MKKVKVIKSGRGRYPGYQINMYGYPSTKASSIGDVAIGVVAVVALIALIYIIN